MQLFVSVRLRHLTHPSRPFIIDLESTNGTLVNDEKIPAARYYELHPGDGTFQSPLNVVRPLTGPDSIVIKFGLSNREYVLMRDDA